MSVSSEFGRRAADDELCAAVAKAVADGDSDALRRLGLDGWGDYVQRLSELMNESVRDGLEQSDDFGALMSQVASPVRYAHHLVTESGTAVQTAKDTPLGIHVKPLEPEFDDDALKGTVGTAASMDDPERAVGNLADGLAYAVKKAGNDFIKANAEQRSRAGFEVKVKRSGSAKCCPWCAARIGSWAIANAPDGVFGCHANCSCVVEYTSSTGAVSQRRGTGRFVEVEYQPPHVMTHEEAREKGGFDEPKRLTGGANGGIIKQESFLNFTPLPQESVVPILRRESEKWIEQLTEEEKRAIKKYTKNSGDPKDDKFYARLNAMLRGERPRDSTLEYYSKLISAGIKKFKLEHDLVCYRNLDFNPFAGVVVGDIIRPLQFFSTSVTPKGALKSNFQIEIHTPKGANGAYIEKLSRYPKQREFLFDKDCLYKTISLNSNNMVLEVIL